MFSWLKTKEEIDEKVVEKRLKATPKKNISPPIDTLIRIISNREYEHIDHLRMVSSSPNYCYMNLKYNGCRILINPCDVFAETLKLTVIKGEGKEKRSVYIECTEEESSELCKTAYTLKKTLEKEESLNNRKLACELIGD